MSDWPNPGGPASNAPPNIAISSGQTIAWNKGGEGTRLLAPPIISNGFIYLYNGRAVAAYDLQSGKRAWSTGLAQKNKDAALTPGGGIATDGRNVYVATSLRTLVALDALTGQQVWLKNTNEPARSAPTVADGRIYVVSTASVVSAYSVGDGAELWRYAGVINSGGLVSASSAAVSGNLVIVPFASGELVALNVTNGTPSWAGSLVGGSAVSGVTRGLSDVAARPVISNGFVYAGSVGGKFVSIREQNGEKIWEQNVPTSNTPSVGGDGVYVLSLSGDLYALDVASGAVRWSSPLPKNNDKRTVWAGPVFANSSLWLISSNGKLVSVDASTGLLLSEKELREGSSLSPIAAGGKLVVATASGGLIALQ
ncbi:MAG: PQQ-binding-like beta-propeller repeat protein, partial [Pseudomonadota bacterium]